MSVFLRNKETRLYRDDANGWAVGAEQAFDFITVPLATRFALDRSLPGLQIVLRYQGLPDEVTMPILAEFCGLDRLGPAAQ